MITTLVFAFLSSTGLALIALGFLPRSAAVGYTPIVIGLGMVLFALLFIPVDAAYRGGGGRGQIVGFILHSDLDRETKWLFVLAPFLGYGLGALIWKHLLDRAGG